MRVILLGFLMLMPMLASAVGDESHCVQNQLQDALGIMKLKYENVTLLDIPPIYSVDGDQHRSYNYTYQTEVVTKRRWFHPPRTLLVNITVMVFDQNNSLEDSLEFCSATHYQEVVGEKP